MADDGEVALGSTPQKGQMMSNTHPITHRRTTTKRRRARLFVALLALVLAGLSSQSAMAASGPFTIDGNVPDAGATNLPDPFGNVKELGPAQGNTTKIGVIHSAAVPMLSLTNPNGQVDLRQAWLTTQKDAAGHIWLYFAWERDANSGSGFIAYEFMQNPAPAGCAYDTATDAQLIANCNPWANRKAGDFMILWDQSGGSKDLIVRTWSGTAPNLTLSAGTTLNSAVSEAAFSADGFRGEAAVDLTATIFSGSTACRLFANTIPSTVTGNSDQADYKDTILKTTPPISNCTSTTVTTPKDGTGANIPADGLSIGTGVVAVKDSAVVDIQGGTATPTGSVAFSLCKVDSPGLCTSGGTTVGSVNLTGASYPATAVSPTAYVTSVGRYCWRATWTGDPANGIPGSSDSRATECFTVNPVTPNLATSAGPDVNLGQTVSDTATLSGTATQPASPVINLTGTAGAPAGGTITFKLYGPDNCTEPPAYTSPTVAVSGNATYNTPNPQFTPTAAGTYHWVAVYSGSPPNTSGTTHNAACDDQNEDVVVTTVASTLSTNQNWLPNDSTTVSAPAGSGNLAGTVSFDLYASADCSGNSIYHTTSAVSGASTQTVSTSNTTVKATASGSYSWKVSYDSTNPAQRDISANCEEQTSLTINNGNPVSSGP